MTWKETANEVFGITPAKLAATFANMESRVRQCLQMEGTQFLILL
jgi:hypothetical protein